MIVEPFKAEHIAEMEIQNAQKYSALVDLSVARAAEGPNAWTIRAAGKPVLCGGVVANWSGYGQAWAVLGIDAARHMLGITRAVKRFFELSSYVRVEALVDVDFELGQKWMRLLGFELETPKPMRKARPDGGAMLMYAKVK